MFNFISRILILLLVLTCCSSKAQTNLKLKQELDSIFIQDQKYRLLFDPYFLEEKGDSVAKTFNITKNELQIFLVDKMLQVDSSNIARVETIIKEYGYPGKQLVGVPTNEVAFYVVQHSDLIPKYIELIEKASKEKEIKFTQYAMMLDRYLMEQNKEQIYGTQGSNFKTLNKENNKVEFVTIIWPIKNASKVNALRKKVGFTLTEEEYAKKLNTVYKVLTLAEVEKMRVK